MIPRLYWPLLSPSVFQGFGANFVWHATDHGGQHPDWDGKLFYGGVIPGINGHNGIDLSAESGTPVYACHAGTVVNFSETDGFLTLRHVVNGVGYETLYGHCQSVSVPVGSDVSAGQEIARSDNRGPYTTGPHLHLQLQELGTVNGTLTRLHMDNGYRGAIDPTPYMAPYGQLARLEDSNQVWQLQGNHRYLVTDKLALYTIGASGYDPVIPITQSQLESFPQGKPVTYAYQSITLSPDQLKDFLRTFTENPSEAQNLTSRYF